MRVLVACESSGTVRDAFRAHGHDAWSCDLLPTTSLIESGYHYTGPVECMLRLPEFAPETWDLLIAHPDCTYLTNSAAWAFTDGPYHQQVKPGTLVGRDRRLAREKALGFVWWLWTLPIPRKCIENPKGCINTRLPYMPVPQYIQPWQFGEDASKGTGLWRYNLPPLVIDPAARCPGRWVVCNGRAVERWSNQTDSGQNRLTPSDDRWQTRAETYPKIARQMAVQWGVDPGPETCHSTPRHETRNPT